MSSPDDPVKKIVSKGKYAQVQSLRAGTMLLGIILFVGSTFCAIITLCLGCSILLISATGTLDALLWGVIFVVVVILSGLVAYMLGKHGVAKIEQSHQMNNVVPLTKANALYLPVQESLVRASAEPPAATETSLLRAVVDTTPTPPEQLVRPSSAPEQT